MFYFMSVRPDDLQNIWMWWRTSTHMPLCVSLLLSPVSTLKENPKWWIPLHNHPTDIKWTELSPDLPQRHLELAVRYSNYRRLFSLWKNYKMEAACPEGFRCPVTARSSDWETWIPSKAQEGATNLSIYFFLSVSLLFHLFSSKTCLSNLTCYNLTLPCSSCHTYPSLLVICQFPVWHFPFGNISWQMRYPLDAIFSISLAPKSLLAPQQAHYSYEPYSFYRIRHLFPTAIVFITHNLQLQLPSPSRISLYAGLL